MQIPDSVQAIGPSAVKHYEECIRNGCTPQFAEMVTLQQPPVYKGSDRAFMEGRLTEGGDTLIPSQRAIAEREARAAGINTSGRYYCGGVADRRQYRDPEAWIGSRDDMLSVAKRRKRELRGQVNYTPPVKAKRRVKDISDRALRDLTKQEMSANPKLTKQDAQDLVREKYIPAGKRKKKT